MRINTLRTAILLVHALFFALSTAFSQQADSTRQITSFSGTVGLTSNGFSIIPSFSLNSPAVIMNYYVRKNRFSFDPDIRLVPDGSKGGMLFWFRCYAIEKKKFSLRTGIHPALNFIRRDIVEDGKASQITEMLRFMAGEIAPTWQINPDWSVGAVLLHGSALQKTGPQRTDVIFLNTVISNIKISKNFRLGFVPMVFYLNTDGYTGSYFSATGILSNQKWPWSFQSTINKTIRSNLPGNRDFMWNVTLNYSFSKKLRPA